MLALYGVRLWDGLRAGIAMRNGKFLLMHWFKAVRLLASTKNMSPANGMQRQPGRKCCQSIWKIAYKSRNAMGKRSWHALIGGVEIGEGFFSVGVSGNKKDEKS